MRITLDLASHKYSIDGIKAVGVSEILQSFGIGTYAGVPNYIIEAAADFGTKGHTMIKYHLLGRLNEETLDRKLYPYLIGLKKLFIEHKIEILDIEKPIACKSLLVCGTPDLICMFDEIKTDLEWKFVKQVKKASQLQSGAYKYLYNANIKEPEEEVKQGKIIQLVPNDYKVFDVGFDCEEEFETLLLAYHIKKAYS